MTRRTDAAAHPLLTADARAIHRGALAHAVRLGHPYLSSEHFLLALASADHPAGVALRAHGVTPERVEEQITGMSGSGLFSDLDREALAAVGIDVNAVCDRVTQTLGPEALHRASRAVFPGHRDRWWDPRRRSVAGVHRDGLFMPVPPGTGVGQCMKHARREAQARNETQIDVQHLGLGMLSVTMGLAPAVLAALGVSVPELRAALSGLD